MEFNGVGAVELFILLAMIAIPVLVAVALVVGLTRRRPQSPDPHAILSERLARGEITPADFETAMIALGYRRTPPTA